MLSNCVKFAISIDQNAFDINQFLALFTDHDLRTDNKKRPHDMISKARQISSELLKRY